MFIAPFFKIVVLVECWVLRFWRRWDNEEWTGRFRSSTLTIFSPSSLTCSRTRSCTWRGSCRYHSLQVRRLSLSSSIHPIRELITKTLQNLSTISGCTTSWRNPADSMKTRESSEIPSTPQGPRLTPWLRSLNQARSRCVMTSVMTSVGGRWLSVWLWRRGVNINSTWFPLYAIQYGASFSYGNRACWIRSIT